MLCGGTAYATGDHFYLDVKFGVQGQARTDGGRRGRQWTTVGKKALREDGWGEGEVAQHSSVLCTRSAMTAVAFGRQVAIASDTDESDCEQQSLFSMYHRL